MRRLKSLRGRLVFVVIGLAALGMVIADAASIVALQVYFRDRADTWLADTKTRVTQAIGRVPVVVTESMRPTTATGLRGHAGRRGWPGSGRDARDGLAGQADRAAHAARGAGQGLRGEPDNAVLQGGPQYRAQMFGVGSNVRYARPDGSQVLITNALLAESLDPTEGALDRLVLFELAATVVALAGIGLLSFGVLKVGLFPLRDMARTAHRIAAGELHQRIDVPDKRSEVGEVAAALNEAFDARQQSEERLRRFVADASHELRTPLTTIRGWAQMHQHGLADEELTALSMSRIQQESARMQELVGDLLTLAELDQQHELVLTRVHLGALATDAVADALVSAPERHIELTLEGDTTVSGEENQLRELLQNLIRNGLVHTPSGTRISYSLLESGLNTF